MRFESLSLEHYGRYKERRLDLSGIPGLAVIHGQNEQGKSTCLAAMTDFLFGIPHTSAYGQVYGYDLMKIVATLRLANGNQVTLQRRKGKNVSRTLLDEQGKVVDEAILARALAAINRPRFESLFGLNHESLRDGGQQLLTADGDIGRLIVEAGGGLKALTGTIDRLAAECDALFAPRRSADRALYKAIDAYMDAETAVKQGLLTHEAYRDARSKYESASATITRLREEQSALRQRQLQLKRLERVIPVLADLDWIEVQISGFSDLPEVGAGFPEQVEQALAHRRSALEQLAEAKHNRDAIQAQLDCLVFPAALLGLEAEIRDASETAVHAAKARTERVDAERSLAESQGKLASLRSSLALPNDADLAPLVPSMDALRRVHELATEGNRLDADIASARQQLQSASDDALALRSQLEQHHGAGTDQPHGLAMTELSALPARFHSREERRKQLAGLQQEIDAALQAAGIASVEALRLLTLPEDATVQAEIDRRTGLETSLERLRETARLRALARDKAQAQIEKLKGEGSVPTDAAIGTARRARTAALAPIKEAYLAPDAAAVAAIRLEDRVRAVSGFESRMSEADSLADRKSLEATRVAELDLAETTLSEASIDIELASRDIRQLEERMEGLTQAWLKEWPDAAAHPALPKLKIFLTTCARILELSDKAAMIAGEAGQLEAEVESGLDILCQAESLFSITLNSSATVAERLRLANKAVLSHDRLHNEFLHAQQSLKTVEQQERKLTAHLQRLLEQQERWQAQWASAVAGLHLEGEFSIQHATAVATEWATAKGVLESTALIQGRLDEMRSYEAVLQRQVAAIAARIDFALPEDSIAAADMLKEKLDAASKANVTRSSLAAQLAHSQNECTRLQQAADSSGDAVDGLAVKAGCPVSGLEQANRRYAELHVFQASRRQKFELLNTSGDGIGRDELRAQQAGRDIDQIRIELAQIDDEETRLQDEIQRAIEAAQDCKRRLEDFDCESSAMAVIASKESAAAEMHHVIEQYLELALAKELLSAAVNQIRTEHQDPLIRRAGELFALATNGAFSAIETDIDDKGIPVVVARRSTGETAALNVLSDGTRDQLFLAFRIASIENYCTAAEPLPFIADDLLVHFDDERSEATLKLLAELGKTTQVLLFTHHRSVAQAAEVLAEKGECGLVAIGLC